jgi:branched-chain amino acid transport system permease protein
MNTVILNGFFVGLLYGLLAIGLVIVYRVSRIVNFAYGETGMVAAFAYLEIRQGTRLATGLPGDHGIVVALPVALLVGAAIGAAMEFFIARPLRGGSTLNGLVATISASLLLIVFASDRWGLDSRPSPALIAGDGVRLLGLTVSPSQLLIAAVVAVVVLALGVVYRWTAIGLRLRATAIDAYAANLVGINTDRTALLTWTFAGALSALSAVLIAPLVAVNVFFMTVFGLRSFAAALIGGLTSVWGAFAAGVLLGILENVIAYKSPISGITDVFVAISIMALMLVRPSGLVRSAY